ncbi:MAG TPA: cyanophycin synthetase [Candidatus Binatia bacterium]|nr:cyanophycin synthetase [Candidatus Binatia bacterium]
METGSGTLRPASQAGAAATAVPSANGILEEALRRLEAAGRFGIVPGLERTRWLLDRLGAPEAGLRGVLVAGTNGKGSVAALVESMARAAGRRTALLSKPHLVRWGERITLDGVPLDDLAFAELALEVLDAADRAPAGEHPTQFEMLTAMGFLASARHRAETVVCEVGMGGARDSTNVADLGGCVVTNVSLDHREWLGDTVEEIAAEKAGIAKRGDWLLTAATGIARNVIAGVARETGASLKVVEAGRDWRGRVRGRRGVEVELLTLPRSVRRRPRGAAMPPGDEPALRCRSPLGGRFQVENLAVAANTAAHLGVPRTAIAEGAAAVRWPGRLQWVEGTPPVLLDSAHNPAAMAALRPEVRRLARRRRVVAVFGAMADKQLEEMLPQLRAMADQFVLTSLGIPRAAPAPALAAMLGTGKAVEPVSAAMVRARRLAGGSGVVLVCGSLALVGAVLAQLEAAGQSPGEEPSPPVRPAR